TAARANDDVPTHTAGIGATTAGARRRSRGLGHINEGTGSRARLESDIRNASHFRVRARRACRTADVAAARRQSRLKVRPREQDAVTAAGKGPGALANAQVVVHDVLYGVHHLRKALHA